jgi:hypothetical protein
MKIIVRHAAIKLVPNKNGVDFWGKTRHYERKWQVEVVQPDPDGSLTRDIMRLNGSVTTSRFNGIDYVHTNFCTFQNKRALDQWIKESSPEILEYGRRRR